METDPIFTKSFTFTRKPEAVPIDNRKLWRVSALCLALSYCRANKASMNKLQLINWAIRSNSSQEVLLQFFLRNLDPEKVIIRFDPGFPITMNIMVGEDLCKLISGKSVQLSEKGVRFVKLIEADENLFTKEKKFLEEVKPYATEKNINSLISEY